MRRVLKLLAPLTLIVALAACGSNDEPTAASTTAAPASGATTSTTTGGAKVKTLKDGTLTVATNLPAPDFFKADPADPTNTSKITGGLEYDIAQELAKRLGLAKVTVVNVPFDSITNGAALSTTNPQADLAFSQVTITDKRKEAVDFSAGYFKADQGVLVRKGTTVSTATMKSLKYGAQADTTGADYVTATIKPTTALKTYPQVTDAVSGLQAKDIDAVILDTPILLSLARDSAGAFEVVGQFKTDEQYGAVLPKGSALTTPVSDAITAMDKDGFIAGLFTKYFGGDPAKVTFLTAG
jgi:polar amino acid transport system substrate-binding protein